MDVAFLVHTTPVLDRRTRTGTVIVRQFPMMLLGAARVDQGDECNTSNTWDGVSGGEQSWERSILALVRLKVLGNQSPASLQAGSLARDASCRGSGAGWYHGSKAAGSVGQARVARLLLAYGDATSGGAVDNAILPASSCTENDRGH